MYQDRTTHILETALWRFAQQGIPQTTTAHIASQAAVSVGTLFRTFPTKEDLLDNVYAHALDQLQAPLLAGPGKPQRSEYLTKLLQRWWHESAQVALAQPHVFDFWRLYRTSPRASSQAAPLLGLFEPVVGLLARALARKTWPVKNPLPVPVMVAGLVGQWTAAVDLVLSEATCQEPTVRQQVLERAYTGWWQGLGLSDFMQVEDLPR
jgi:AcrR family transcriptional regulator